MQKEIPFPFDIEDSDINEKDPYVDDSPIEDNDELFWEHKHTQETDNDGFPAYECESLSTNKKINKPNINFMNTDL